MANATDKQAVFEQALSDAGFGDARKAECCECYEEGDWNTLSKLLQSQKNALLDKVHEGQKQIDCIDYLTYSLKRKQ